MSAATTVADRTSAPRIPRVFAIWLIVAGVIGEFAAFMLTVEKFDGLKNPGTSASCDISVFVQCTKNLDSWQGEVFGFPNPLIGLVAWMAPIVVGFALLAGARFARWFWMLFNLGILGAVAFVIWLAAQSIFSLNTLCPYCVLTWSVTYPAFFAVTFRNMAEGVFGERVRTAGSTLLGWVAPITIVVLLIIFLIAQSRMPVVQSLF